MFCGDAPATSREHGWSDWLGKYLPPDPAVNHQVTSSSDHWLPVEMRDAKPPRSVSGPSRSRKFKVVCNRCNNEWMSQLEERSKALLTRMIDGEELELSRADQKLLARWADKISLVYDYGETSSVVTSAEQRKAFMTLDTALPLTQVWLGTFTPRLGDLRHRRYTYVLAGNVDIRLDTMVMGPVVFYVVSTSDPERFGHEELRVDGTPMSEYVVKIWPLTQDKVDWPLSAMHCRQYYLLSEMARLEIGVRMKYDLEHVPPLMTPQAWCDVRPDELMRLIPGVGLY